MFGNAEKHTSHMLVMVLSSVYHGWIMICIKRVHIAQAYQPEQAQIPSTQIEIETRSVRNAVAFFKLGAG